MDDWNVITCPTCRGYGTVQGKDRDYTCETCRGDGAVEERVGDGVREWRRLGDEQQ